MKLGDRLFVKRSNPCHSHQWFYAYMKRRLRGRLVTIGDIVKYVLDPRARPSGRKLSRMDKITVIDWVFEQVDLPNFDELLRVEDKIRAQALLYGPDTPKKADIDRAAIVELLDTEIKRINERLKRRGDLPRVPDEC